MKYFGKKSLSSVMSILLRIAWYLSWVAAVAAVGAGVVIVFHSELGLSLTSELSKSSAKDIHDWEYFQGLPLGIRILIFPYFGGIMALLMIIIKKTQGVFANFRNEIVFNAGNVRIIADIGKLVIVFSILTFSFSTLLVGILLLVLCEIVRNGTALQEEHDLTV